MTLGDHLIGDISGEILATGVSFEDYLERFAGIHCELVGGVVVKMSPATLQHNNIQNYVYMLFSAYFELKSIGRVISQPFTLRLPNVDAKREPDLFVVLNNNPHELKETFMDGPPDICIEVVSADSIDWDRGTKFREYEAGGVREYWIIDPLHQETLLYRLGHSGVYIRQLEDKDGSYQTPILPEFVFNVPVLWQSTLPGLFSIAESVKPMLSTTNN